MAKMNKDIVNKALLDLIKKYPLLPVSAKSVEYQKLEAKRSCFSVSSLSGEIVLQEDILGNYVAQFPFSITYRVLPEDSADKINAEDLLANIGIWLESQVEYPSIGSNKKILSIKRGTVPTVITVNEDGTFDYQCIFELKYEVKEM